jgi:organic hydroperoxide reductase OsmC/OhrA
MSAVPTKDDKNWGAGRPVVLRHGRPLTADACEDQGLAARKMKVTLPPDFAIDAEVDLNLGDGGYFLRARLNVSVPRVDRKIAQAVVDAAHETCPYSKATRGNIDVTINLV